MTNPSTPHDGLHDGGDNDVIHLLDDIASVESGKPEKAWLVLIVDDEQDVHDVTELSLRGMLVEDREIQFLHAYTCAQARQIVADHPDIAVILLDVVMESHDAGLQLVQVVRKELARSSVRIVLRTGQPGFAPEIETIQKYDINDYRTKTELTQVRLYTSMAGAIRSYRHLVAMEETRRGLEVVVQASTELSQVRGVALFAKGMVIQLCALMNIQPDGLVCARSGNTAEDGAIVIVATGIYAPLMATSVEHMPQTPIRNAIEKSLQSRASVFGQNTVLYFPGAGESGMAAFVDAAPLSATDQHLIQVFCSSMTVGLENVLLHEKIFSLAYQDPLLGIPNRNRFVDIVDAQLQRPDGVAVALIDLDDFAGDNAMFGHSFGDELLRAFSARLARMLGPEVVIARLSGDTFAAVGNTEHLNPDALGRCLTEPLLVQSLMMVVSATCGLVRLTAPASDGAEILKQAYVALKLAKSQHRGACMYYSDAMGTDATERSTLLRGLREAFEAHRLFVVYQPQVGLPGGSVLGAEALLRWRTDEGKFVSPDQFIPLAEQSGLMVSIGEFVLRTACHQLRRIQGLGFHGFRMSVNVSQVQFREPDFVQSVRRAIADAEISAENLELEITESMAAEQLDFVLAVLDELHQIGVTVAIDDFGTGYSSLSILRQLHLDRLKIDKSFVSDLSVMEGVAKSIIDIGRSLSLELIAEGVEKQGQADRLFALGCKEAQGYLYSKPLPPEDLEQWLLRAKV
jgi:diguanylate cyclase (GGDEF)-like protein